MKLALLGATAFLGATSAQAQVADNWTIGLGGSDNTITSANTANITLNGNDAGTSGAVISDGIKNSISGSAIGSSASAGYTVTSGVEGGLTATVAGPSLQVTSTSAGNVTNIGTIETPEITAGNSNSISRVALGASASNSASVFATGSDSAIAGAYNAPVVTVSATNGLATDVDDNSFATTVFTGTAINEANVGGNSNSVSAAAIGSSASVGASTVSLGGETAQTFTFGTDLTDPAAPAAGDGLTITSTNLSNVALAGADSEIVNVDNADPLTATLDTAGLTQSTLSGTIGSETLSDSISATALGASASFSYSTTVYDGAVNNTALVAAFDDAGTISASGAITVTSVNGGISDAGTITKSETPVTVTNLTDISAASIGSDGANNSISVSGSGSSASVGFSVTDYASAANEISNVLNAGTVIASSTNFANVTVASGMASPQIDGGISNSIATTALGASASQSFTAFIK